MRIANTEYSRRGNLFRVVTEIRHLEIAQQEASVRVRIRPHTFCALGRKLRQFRFQATVLIEEFLGAIALQPVFEHLEVLGMGSRVGKRYLVRPESTFNLQAIDYFRSGPSLRRIEN